MNELNAREVGEERRVFGVGGKEELGEVMKREVVKLSLTGKPEGKIEARASERRKPLV